MEISRQSCRLCLSETDFNVSLFGNYSRKTNLLDKILVCLRLPIEENEALTTICHKCVNNIEKYYDFIAQVKKNEVFIAGKRNEQKTKADESQVLMNKRVITSFVREQVREDADYTFSFLEMPKNEQKKDSPKSSSLFSYLSPPSTPNIPKNAFKPPSDLWKTHQKSKFSGISQNPGSPKRVPERYKKELKSSMWPRHHSRDLFESQSQDVEDEPKSFDWKLTPDDGIIKRVRDNFFALSEY